MYFISEVFVRYVVHSALAFGSTLTDSHALVFHVNVNIL